MAKVIQAMTAEAGFDISIVASESASMVAANRRGGFDAAIVIWSGRPDPDGTIAIWLQCDGSVNRGKDCNPPLDELLPKARAVTAVEERQALYAQAAAIWMEDRPHLEPYHHRWLWASGANVEGFQAHPDGMMRLQVVRPGR